MRSFLRTFGLLSAAIALASCAAYQPLGTTFIRADGQDASPDQLATDRTSCVDAADKLESCMTGKGYALVRDDEVAEKQKEFAENAEKKKQEQVIRSLDAVPSSARRAPGSFRDGSADS